MFALFGLLPLLIFLYLRPQEHFVVLRSLPMLNLMTALAVLGFVIDLRMARTKVVAMPALRYVAAWLVWGIVCTTLRAGGNMSGMLIAVGILMIEMLLIAHAITSFRNLQILTATLLSICLLITGICLHQAQQPFGCFAVKDVESDRELAGGKYDGRPCETWRDCENEAAEPGSDYSCEKPGLMGTSSIGHGRVRYRGILQDPNYVALAIALCVPLSFAFWQRRKTLLRGALALSTVGLVGWCIVKTQSRGGQLVFLATLGVYFVRRFGFGAGVAMAALGGIPVLLLGGRSGEEAESSAQERIEILNEGIEMVRQSPILGVGMGQFTEHHYMTAHNAYLLCAAEVGLPGFFLWNCLLYLSVKTPVVVLRRYTGRPEAQAAVSWAMAVLSAMCGLLVGIFFLSFTYHPVLYIHLGLCGALYAACRRHDPGLRVTLSLRELLGIGVGSVTLIALIGLYARLKS